MALDDQKTDEILFATMSGQDDTRALDTLFSKYYEKLCHFSYRFVKDAEMSREIVSDVFLKIWTSRKKIQLKNSFKLYIYLAVKNQALDYIKKEKKNVIRSSVEFSGQEAGNVSEQPDQNLHHQDFKATVDYILSTMPPRQSQILRLSKLDGFKNPEIAEILGVSEKTVRNQLVEALKFIAKKHPNFKSLLSLAIIILLTLFFCFILY